MARIAQESSVIDKAVAKAHRENSLVQEYRTRLIADVVTGKLDVREAAANLADEPEEVEPPDELDAGAGVGEDAGAFDEPVPSEAEA